MSLKKKILSIVLAILLVFLGSGAIYAYNILAGLGSGQRLNESALSINTLSNTDVINVALFGIDGREDVDGDRTDTIMIASIDLNEGDVQVTSIMRDLYVRIPAGSNNEENYDKINAAYMYGGPQQSIQTINENFDMNISDYVVVNFNCLVDSVDALGGVDIDVKNGEVVYWTNQYIGDVNEKTGHNDPYLERTGMQTLTGVQALAYCRNRYSDDDYGRTERQREVVKAMFDKAINADIMTTLNIINKVYPYIQTSFSLNEITQYAGAYMSLNNKTFKNGRIPFDGYNTTADINETSYVVPVTLEDNAVMLHKLIYGENNDYTPSDTVKMISNNIVSTTGLSHGSAADPSTYGPGSNNGSPIGGQVEVQIPENEVSYSEDVYY